MSAVAVLGATYVDDRVARDLAQGASGPKWCSPSTVTQLAEVPASPSPHH